MAAFSEHDVIGDLFGCLRRVDFNPDVLSGEEMSNLISVLQKLAEEVVSVNQCENRVTLPAATLDTLCSILNGCLTPIDGGTDSSLLNKETVRTVCSWCLRCLRNSCVQSPSSQRSIWEAGVIGPLGSLIRLVTATSSPRPEELMVCLRCAVQLLGNLVSGQPELQALMWKEVFPQTLLSVFHCADTKASQYLCVVINLCLQASPPAVNSSQLWTGHDGYQLVEAALTLCEIEAEQDFSLQLLQTLIAIPDFIPSVFAHLNPSSKLLLLDILAAFLSQSDGTSSGPPPLESPAPQGLPCQPPVAFLAQVFEEEAGGVFGLVSEAEWSDIKEQKKPQLVMRLLNILCTVTSYVQANGVLQQRASLLQCSLGLLDRAHNVGKKSKNLFTSTQTLKTLKSADVQSNPVFGFKRDLVRLIGNMCHHHTANQNKLRELHGISVLLEQCSIDDSNPFISQWAIFALHNLCEGNVENQAVIAEMTNRGVVNNDQLQQYGFQAECRDGQMYYKSSRKK